MRGYRSLIKVMKENMKKNIYLYLAEGSFNQVLFIAVVVKVLLFLIIIALLTLDNILTNVLNLM